jgi:hypothetical protein
MHTIKECPREVGEEIRRHSRKMDKWTEKVREQVDRGCCEKCWVPRAVCEGWQWDEQQGRWVEDSSRECQYGGVLIPAMMAMMKFGAADAVRRVAERLHSDRVDPANRPEVYRWYSKRIWWEGVEAEQVVVALMILAQGNGVLGALY